MIDSESQIEPIAEGITQQHHGELHEHEEQAEPHDRASDRRDQTVDTFRGRRNAGAKAAPWGSSCFGTLGMHMRHHPRLPSDAKDNDDIRGSLSSVLLLLAEDRP